MSHRCFISFKTEDKYYKEYIQKNLKVNMIDHSLNEPIDSDDEDYIMRKIREDYLADSTVTIHLIGLFSAENRGPIEQFYIKRELQASLFHGEGNTQNGILGVVLPSMTGFIFRGPYTCSRCGIGHTAVELNDSTVIREFSYNFYIPNGNKCSWEDDERFCVLVSWDDFVVDPELYIEKAFEKRNSDISKMTKVRP